MKLHYDFHKKSKNIFAFILVAIIALSTSFLGARLYKKDSGIKFSHKLHKEQGSDCAACHKQDSKDERFMDFPGHANCTSCHEDALSKNCNLCHTDSKQKTFLRKNQKLSPLVVFKHTKHKNAGVSCQSCHVAAFNSTRVTGNELLPKMKICVDCHKEKNISKPDYCTFCHVSGSEKIRPFDHSSNWLKLHGKDAKLQSDQENCNICHTKANGNDCQSCHRREKPSTHTLGWRIRTHAHAASTDRSSCNVCHTQNDCVSCHTTTKPFTHTAMWGGAYSRHCNHCHLDSSGYVSGSVDKGNCSVCHTTGQIFAKHKSKMVPTHYRNNCTNCHGVQTSAPRIKHPYPDGVTSCIQCH